MNRLNKILFYKFLSRTLQQGLLLEQAVHLFAQESSLKHWKILHIIEKELRRGKPLSQALAKTKKFSAYEINFLQLAETSAGAIKKQNLSQSLLRLSKIIYQEQFFKKRITSFLLYPLFLACGALVLLFVLLFLILPRLDLILQAAPQKTSLLLKILFALQQYILAFFSSFEYPLLLLFLLTILFLKLFKSEKSRIFLEILLLNFPVLGSLLKKQELCRLCFLWAETAHLQQSRQKSLHLLLRSTKWKTYQFLLGTMAQTKPLSKIWRKQETRSPLPKPGLSKISRLAFPPLFRKMIELGERTQSLEDELLTISQIYQDEIETDLKHSLALLEPLLILGVAVLVGIIAYSAYSAYWEIIKLFFHSGLSAGSLLFHAGLPSGSSSAVYPPAVREA